MVSFTLPGKVTESKVNYAALVLIFFLFFIFKIVLKSLQVGILMKKKIAAGAAKFAASIGKVCKNSAIHCRIARREKRFNLNAQFITILKYKNKKFHKFLTCQDNYEKEEMK